ncbi:MAG: sensor histidine kinase [Acidobacteriota bacterium]
MGLIGALAYEAMTAARAQRETVEGVLRDYAEIAAEQYAGGVSTALDYSWFFPVVRQLSSNAGALQAPAVGAEIRTQTGDYEVDSLVSGFFAGSPETGEWIGADGWPEPPTDAGHRQLVDERAAAALEEGWPFAISMLPGDGPDRVLVVRATREPDTGRVDVAGFRAPLTGFEVVLARALDPSRVLPASFIDPSGGELVALRLVGDDDRILYERGPEFDPAFSATADLGPRLGGLRVQAAIPASSARDLVIGGLPRSRLPAIGLMLAVAVALLAGGVLVIRQERELVRLRERFVAGASHELRTPLAQIRMFAETLRLDRVRSPRERDRSLEILDREAQRLSYLVENLLVFSRPESQRKRAAPERIELHALAADVLDGFAPLARDRGATLELTGREDVVVEIDRDQMRQVLLNLLDNATKYGPEGQTVTISVGRDAEGGAVLSVEDEGPGVPAGERSLVWARFWRGAAVDGTTGTGIGLSIVKELVELGGGEVTVADAPGGGARFRIVLPEAG